MQWWTHCGSFCYDLSLIAHITQTDTYLPIDIAKNFIVWCHQITDHCSYKKYVGVLSEEIGTATYVDFNYEIEAPHILMSSNYPSFDKKYVGVLSEEIGTAMTTCILFEYEIEAPMFSPVL